MTGKRTDGNQTEIVKTLRAYGVSVDSTASVGNGFPDLSCGHRGINYLFEVKDPAQPPSKRKLTPDEQDWHDRCKGQVHVIETAEEALHIMGIGVRR